MYNSKNVFLDKEKKTKLSNLLNSFVKEYSIHIIQINFITDDANEPYLYNLMHLENLKIRCLFRC